MARLTEFDLKHDRWKACVDNHLLVENVDDPHARLMGDIVDKLAEYEHGDHPPLVRCEKCTHHDTESCPEGRVWCKKLIRYMDPDGYCSYGG